MSFSQELWQRNLGLYQKTLALPFNQQLAQGTLSREAFSHYVIQDAHYLLAYGRALAVCAAKAFEADDVIQFAEAAKIAIVVERSLHDGFMQDFGISKDQFETTPLTLACHHYTSYLTSTAWSESYPVVLASLLPCFWIYAEVGKDIVDNSAPNNPYQALPIHWKKCTKLIRMRPVWNGYSGTAPLSNASGLVWTNKMHKKSPV